MTNRDSLKPSCGCVIDRLLRHDETYIFITGAHKQSDSLSGKGYIAYNLRIGVN
jgi:sorting nexin-4